MSATSLPTWTVPVDMPVFLTGLPEFARQLRCRIQYANHISPFIHRFLQAHLLVVELSAACAVLIIGPKAVPAHLTDLPAFKAHLEDFLDEYSSPIVIWQGYQTTLTTLHQRDPPVALALRGMIMRHTLIYRHALVPTRHLADTALCLRSLAKRVQIIDKPPSTARIKPKARTLYDAQLTFLEGLCLMGEKKVKQLTMEFASPAAILTELRATDFLYTRTGNPKGITGKFAAILGFDFEFIRQNQILLSHVLSDGTDNPL